MHYDLVALTPALARLAHQQGRLDARLALAGFDLGQGADLAMLAAMAQDAIKTSEIEGETLNAHSVRSSLARRMGVGIGARFTLKRLPPLRWRRSWLTSWPGPPRPRATRLSSKRAWPTCGWSPCTLLTTATVALPVRWVICF